MVSCCTCVSADHLSPGRLLIAVYVPPLYLAMSGWRTITPPLGNIFISYLGFLHTWSDLASMLTDLLLRQASVLLVMKLG